MQPAMAHGVPRQMHGTQPQRSWQNIAIIKPMIHAARAIPQQPAAYGFAPSTHPRPAMIAMLASDVRGVQARSRHPRARLLDQRGDIQRVIQMPMREDDATNRQPLPAASRQLPTQRFQPTHEPRVDEIQSIVTLQNMEGDDPRPHRDASTREHVMTPPPIPLARAGSSRSPARAVRCLRRRSQPLWPCARASHWPYRQRAAGPRVWS